MIPTNITKEVIDKVILDINDDSIPLERKSYTYFLESHGKFLPPKYVVDVANKLINGDQITFNSIEAVDLLKDMGYKIIKNSKYSITKHDFIKSILMENDNNPMETDAILTIYLERCSEDVEKKRQFYIDKGDSKGKNDDELKQQLYAEFCKEGNDKDFIFEKIEGYKYKVFRLKNFTNENETKNEENEEFEENEEIENTVIHPLYIIPNTNDKFPDGLGSLCVNGESGVGKSYRVEKTFENHNLEIIIPSKSSDGLLVQFSPRKKDYILGIVGKILIEASKNLDKYYTIAFDEIHKPNFIDMINDELLQCLSTKRNDGIRVLPKFDSETDELFNSLGLNKGRRVITDNIGFIFITSNEDAAITHNPDFKNRIELIKLTQEDRNSDLTTDFLFNKIEIPENENDIDQ